MKKLFTILVMLVAINASAQWVQMGSEITGGVIWSFSSSGSNLYVGTENYGVFTSTNSGLNWSQTSLNNKNVRSVLANGSNIFAGTYSYGVFISTNSGINWSQTSMNSHIVSSLIISGNYLFAGTIDSGVYVTTNNGTNWSHTIFNNQWVQSLASNGNNIYAATYDSGVFISTNNGNNWTRSAQNIYHIYSIAVSGNNIFIGTYSNGVYISTNSGTTWNQTSLNNKWVNSILTFDNNIFAGTSANNGVYHSTNNGINWNQRNEGFNVGPTLLINSLFLSNNYIYSGTNSYSVWRRSLSEIIGIQNISTETPSKYSLSQNYPNPFNPTTNIKFSIVNSGDVKLVVYDIQGCEVQTLVNESLKPGTYETAFDGSALNSGVYFYKLVTGNFTETKKMLLIK